MSAATDDTQGARVSRDRRRIVGNGQLVLPEVVGGGDRWQRSSEAADRPGPAIAAVLKMLRAQTMSPTLLSASRNSTCPRPSPHQRPGIPRSQCLERSPAATAAIDRAKDSVTHRNRRTTGNHTGQGRRLQSGRRQTANQGRFIPTATIAAAATTVARGSPRSQLGTEAQRPTTWLSSFDDRRCFIRLKAEADTPDS